MEKTHKDFDVWKMSLDFFSRLYKVSASFPREEIYGLTSQMKRSAFSIPSNIAEGYARKLERLNEQDYFQFSNELNTISRMLQGLIKSKKSKMSPITN